MYRVIKYKQSGHIVLINDHGNDHGNDRLSSGILLKDGIHRKGFFSKSWHYDGYEVLHDSGIIKINSCPDLCFFIDSDNRIYSQCYKVRFKTDYTHNKFIRIKDMREISNELHGLCRLEYIKINLKTGICTFQ